MTKEREETALEDDLLQMEVQRLTDLLHSKAGAFSYLKSSSMACHDLVRVFRGGSFSNSTCEKFHSLITKTGLFIIVCHR